MEVNPPVRPRSRLSRLCPIWLGRMIRLSTRLNISAQPTTTGKAPIKSPICPSMNRSGTNATMLVNTVATTGQNTCSVPKMAAVSAGSLRSYRAWMFSATTIASSTSSPTTTISPNMVSRLSVMPTIAMITSAPQIDTTSPTPTQHATRQLRNIMSVAKTSSAPHFALRRSRSRRPSMNRARSECVEISAGNGGAERPSSHARWRGVLSTRPPRCSPRVNALTVAYSRSTAYASNCSPRQPCT